ncbi:MAG: potassium transporter TrkG, partial [Candidatus Pelethousia sp.]|nr:potassium transporter TrkG [Candidatus Pelethousia sp.]
ISAFCNAGFDLMGILEPSSSLTAFVDDPLVVLTIASLIIVGGIGFVVWSDLVECGFFRPEKFKLHTLTALMATIILIVTGTAAFLFLERDGELAGMDAGTRVLAAFFQSVTPRTAGFNTLNTAGLSDGGKLATMVLMFVGAAPGGTGGGVKVTTLAVIAAAVFSSLRNREDVSIWHFRLDTETLRRSFCGITTYTGLALGGMLILCAQNLPFTDAAFECLSAIGTVGLSTGITTALPPLSRVAIILLMYAGRVGSLTVFLAVVNANGGAKLRNPIGKIIVG